MSKPTLPQQTTRKLVSAPIEKEHWETAADRVPMISFVLSNKKRVSLRYIDLKLLENLEENFVITFPTHIVYLSCDLPERKIFDLYRALQRQSLLEIQACPLIEILVHIPEKKKE